MLADLAAGFRRAIRGTPTDQARTAIDELLPTGRLASRFLLQFVALTVLSSSIAAVGLLADSASVVIGAMLVAPFMTPILGASASVVQAHNRRLLWALAVIAVGTLVAVGVGWLVSALTGQSIGQVLELPDEVRSRTAPGLLDLGVAVTAGAAAGYVAPRQSTFAALPGVGIAVALVPPLAAAGIAYERGLGDLAGGALLLYATNLAAIIFVAALMFVLSGFRPDARAALALPLRLAATGVFVALVAVPLSLHTRAVLIENQLRSSVVKSIPQWDNTTQATSVRAVVNDGVAEVELQVVGPNDPLPAWRLAEAISEEFGGPVELTLRYDQIRQFEVSRR